MLFCFMAAGEDEFERVLDKKSWKENPLSMDFHFFFVFTAFKVAACMKNEH